MNDLPDHRQQFASRLRGLREAAKLSIERASEQGGVSPTFWGNVERTEQEPCLDVIVGFAKGLGISVPTLMTLRDDDTRPVLRMELDNLLDLFNPQQLRLITQIARLIVDYKWTLPVTDPQSSSS